MDTEPASPAMELRMNHAIPTVLRHSSSSSTLYTLSPGQGESFRAMKEEFVELPSHAMNDKRGLLRNETRHTTALILDTDESHELNVDYKGRKHVEVDTDGGYTIQQNFTSTHTQFEMPGKRSADALRNSLRPHLPLFLITDEYGDSQPLNEISNRHLPNLQAKLWRDLPLNHIKNMSLVSNLRIQSHACGPLVRRASTAKLSASVDEASLESSYLMASHVERIANLLNDDHIFVFRDGLQCICSNSSCLKNDIWTTTSTQFLRLEPLLDWGTVTPASGLHLSQGKLLAFSRSGEKSSDPLWTRAIKKLVPDEAVAYCLTCLEELMDRQVEAWTIIERINRDSDLNNIQESMQRTHSVNFRDGRNKRRVESAAKIPACTSDLSGNTEFHANLGYLSDDHMCLMLDGSNSPRRSVPDRLSTSHPFIARDCSLGSTSTTSDFSRDQENRARERGFVDWHYRTTSIDNTKPTPSHKASAWITVNESSSTSTTKSTQQKYPALFRDTPSTFDHNPFRKFGREIDPNATISLFREDMIKGNAEVDMRAICPSLNHVPTKVPYDAEVAKARHDTVWGSSGSDLSDVVTEVGDEMEMDLQPTKFASPKGKLPTLKRKASPAKSISVLQLKNGVSKSVPTTATPQLPKIPKPQESPTAEKTKTSIDPVFAKRSPLLDSAIPSDVERVVYETYLSTVPAPTTLICACHKPAGTYTVKIAQCGSKDCPFGWHHYDCLDKSEKLRVRFGTMICAHCRLDRDFKDTGARNGWSVERMVDAELKVPWSGREMVDMLPGPGGQALMNDPYGLATTTVTTEPDVPTQSAPSPHGSRALGSLAFMGYAVSRPFVVTEAYTNAQAYIDLSPPSEYDGDDDYNEDEYDYDDDDDDDDNDDDDEVSNASATFVDEMEE